MMTRTGRLLFAALICLSAAASGEESSGGRLLAGSGARREALEIGAAACLLAWDLGSLRHGAVWPSEPRIDSDQAGEYARDSVSSTELIAASALLGAGIGLLPNREGRPSRVSYRHAKGFVEATLVATPLLTDFAKLWAGKRRPYYEAAIAANPGMGDGERRELSKSFWSGHSAVAFSAATYFNLYLAQHLGDGSRRSLAWKGPVALGLFGLAGLVAHSRVDDHAHDTLDVTAGACAGTLTALFFYALHDGRLWSIYGDEAGGSRLGLAISPRGVGVYRNF